MANEAIRHTKRIHSRFLGLALAVALAALLTLSASGIARADEPTNSDAEPAPAPSVTVEHRTYNVFNFPVVGDVLDAVLKGMSDAMRGATQPTFATMNLVLKTPTLASDGEAGPGQLNFYAIVEPLWRLAALPVAGVLGFVLLLYAGIAMQVSAVTQSPRSIGLNMEGLVATVTGLALAAFSLQFFHLANEAANVLVDMIVQAPGPGQGIDPALMASQVLTAAGIASPLASIIIAIILLIPTLLLLMMAVARWALFFIVVVLSPLAAVSLGSSLTKRLTSLWGQMFLFVMLLGPANAILLRSIQGLYDMSLGSLGHMEEMPRAVASGAVMFGLLSTAGALNFAAVQRAFGAALGWVGAAVTVTVGALAASGAVAGAIAGGGGLAALGSSLSRAGRGIAGGALSGQSASSSLGSLSSERGAGSGQGLGGVMLAPSSAGLGSPNSPTAKGSPEAAPNTPEGWREQYQARRREGFDWSRAAVIGGSLAAMAPGPVGRAGMAARLLGMAGMVEDRFSRGVEERDQVREEARERWTEAGLRDQRSQIFGRPSGPIQVERAGAIDRAVASVSRRTSDQEGLRAGLISLGRSAAGQSVLKGDAYDGIARLNQEIGGSEPSRIERVAGLHLEAELMSRGTLRGEPVYATGQTGTLQMELRATEGIGRSLGFHDGSRWQGVASGEPEQIRGQVLGLVQRLNTVGHLPQGRAYAEELGRDPSIGGSQEALDHLETFVKQIEDKHQKSGPTEGQA